MQTTNTYIEYTHIHIYSERTLKVHKWTCMFTHRICIYVRITTHNFFTYELVHTNEHSTQSAVRQSRLRLRGKQTLPCGDRNGKKGQSRTQDSAERLSVSWWCKPGLGVAWIKRAVCCVCAQNMRVEINTSDCRVGNTLEAPFFTYSTWEVRCLLGMFGCAWFTAFWFGLHRPGWVGLERLGAEIPELLNIPGSSPSFQID